ncbi:MAG: ABC transporter ATP-binding protein/permease [Solobacterium sp.]|jgi:ABC-type multidrug transport system fused ATPase/permease subunit|nr:ABC transporter ATP-binding protein/permease [Solobacterium sp.]MCH4205683.1 ABC transporter ATP-binding protein/permease [Solobacterium sp.]MCH4227207.1 ABC transporter ATP-binding protein/permease [Solobacterium sp.]MCH4282513.1 ABC transporter ATP-binding protein/permease [Solobacterium sp.]
MKELKKYLKGHEKETVLAPLFKLLEACMDLLVPLAVAALINQGIANHDTQYIFYCFLFILLLAVLGLFFSVIAQYYAAKVSAEVGTDLRQDLFDHIEAMSFSTLDTLGSSTLITRLTSDINQIQTGINMGLRLLLRSPFIVFGSMILAFTINVKAALVFAVAIPILAAAVFGIMLVSIPLFRKVQAKLDAVMHMTRENLNGVRVIRAFGKEREEVKDFDQKNEDLTKINEFVGKISALLNPLTYALINIAAAVLIYVGALQVNYGEMLQGDTVALYSYMAQMIIELIKLASLIITINKSIACGNRVFQILAIDPGMSYPAANVSSSEHGTIAFEHVSMRYKDASEDALSDLNFAIHAGQTVGIIGGTGSGKSTLINLIPRFYDVNQGEVKVDGINVKDYGAHQLTDLIGIVPQKAVLFQGTIRDNMKWGREDASDAEIEQALITAQAKEIVDGKGGLDYVLQQHGANLSGGQKQRLTIARALVKRPEILILDDSASALDFATDAALRRALRDIAKDTVIIIVSQRISSMMGLDKVLVLNDGCLAGSGTHEQLLKNCSVYQEIYASQYPEKSTSSQEVLA